MMDPAPTDRGIELKSSVSHQETMNGRRNRRRNLPASHTYQGFLFGLAWILSADRLPLVSPFSSRSHSYLAHAKSGSIMHQKSRQLVYSALDENIQHDNTCNPQQQQQQPPTTPANSNTEFSFFDEAIIFVRAGPGGQGASTYRKGVGGQNGPPDGGNGGRGGNVILQVDDSLNTLAGLNPQAFRPNSFGGSGAAVKSPSSANNNNNQQQWTSVKTFRAEHGANGERQFKNGRYGQHVTVRLPPGTVVQEQITRADGSIYHKNLGSVTIDNPTMIVAQGGEGGEGSGVASAGRGVRRKRIGQQGGEKKTLMLTLKIVADVALVGAPNAGKSTLLAAVTRAKPKIANYPFTTVIPNLGVWIPPESDYRDQPMDGRRHTDGAGSEGLALCDVPGLIEGAAKGIGLGHAFLRHIERCHVILHLVDPTAPDPLANFDMINQEITKYGTGQLAKMPQVVVINKSDVWDNGNNDSGVEPTLSKEDLEAQLRQSMSHTRLMWMSAKEKDGVDDLMIRLESFVKKVKKSKEETTKAEEATP
ncbi:GTPase Obg [Seminavis robusta]|uniref:GTPase Obg n=1 Tax=Seminavis robusta TaxID=568900 RepID=A0A9N8E4U8_9STRA|nr:GTPase Obg [Seminavis robusta]|eukprot:Sro621_g176740.1 GTPase Obg (533) ;mRNA; r:19603-21417